MGSLVWDVFAQWKLCLTQNNKKMLEKQFKRLDIIGRLLQNKL